MVRIAVAALITFAVSVFAVGDPAGAANVGNKQGKQFITGGCTSNADCASGCCAGFQDGAICSGPAVGNVNGKTGCGFNGGGAAAGGNNNNNKGGKKNNNNGSGQKCAREWTA